jgi:glycerol-3-phosphate cytidylyltransferase
MKTVITYGRFDILHIGHLNLFRSARSFGDRLIVGLSTDEYAALRNKPCQNNFANRFYLLDALGLIDRIIPEFSYMGEKERDIKRCDVDIVYMGEEYADLSKLFLGFGVKFMTHPRTPDISSSLLKGIANDSGRVGA